MDKFGKIIGFLIFGFASVVLMALVMGYPVMWLWNYTMPSIAGLPEIDFYHAIALNVLCSILFRSSNSSKKKKDDTDGEN
jgi:hypothetical protein